MKPIDKKEFDLLVVGETLVEFSCESDLVSCESFKKDIGGADVVVAAAAARLGSRVQLLSAIARDPYHAFIRERLSAQGINIDYVNTYNNCYNGTYFTSSYHPESREYLVHHPGTASQHIQPPLVYDGMIENSKIVYASSELQAVSRQTRHAVFKAFYTAHNSSVLVAYDPNLRLQRWSLEDARENLWNVLALIDVIFISSPEESKALIGYERPLDVIGYLWDRGVHVVVVKMGAEGCMIGYNKEVRRIEHPDIPGVVVTAPVLVGSAFNGAFLHCYAHGYDAFTAAELANSAALYKGIKGGGIESLPTAGDVV
jgi:2-dehydro-3-deoxygluconokinase